MTVPSKKLIPFTIATGVLLITAGLWAIHFFEGLDHKFYDTVLVSTSRYTRVSDDICIIAVDQESITQATGSYGWGWPWPREAFGKIIDFMAQGSSGPMVLDILFTEPSIYGPQDDESFARSMADHGGVIIDMMSSQSGTRLLKPLPLLEDAAALVADSVSSKDSDGVIRCAVITQQHTAEDGTVGESVSLPYAPLIVENGSEMIDELKKTVPTDKNGKVLLRFKGDLNRYHPYHAIDILESGLAIENGGDPLFYPEDFEDAYVFVIYNAPGLYDICQTPVSTMYQGSGVSVTALDNWLLDDFITPVNGWIIVLVIVACSFLSAWFSYGVSKINATRKTILFSSVFFILGPVVLLAAAWLLMLGGIYLQIMAPLTAYLTGYVGVTFYSYIAEGRQKRFIKAAFSQYLSECVINNLLSDPSQLQLGGEKRNITVFFSDIKGFTSIGEQLSPELLTEVLNIYLTELSTIIMETGGTIDKYVGDAIVAFWNAPAAIEGHASKALLAALQCQEQVQKMVERLQPVIIEPLYTRIGINTGESIVGNMGSRSRFNYTMFGDAVNTGSRLEGLNKQFGTYVLCTETTKEQAEAYGTIARFREIGRVLVIGKTEPVTVYEPMSPKRWDIEMQGIENFSAALQLFYQGKLEDALSAFTANSEKNGDAPSKYYAVRCCQLLDQAKENPAILENWQGIWVASSK